MTTSKTHVNSLKSIYKLKFTCKNLENMPQIMSPTLNSQWFLLFLLSSMAANSSMYSQANQLISGIDLGLGHQCCMNGQRPFVSTDDLYLGPFSFIKIDLLKLWDRMETFTTTSHKNECILTLREYYKCAIRCLCTCMAIQLYVIDPKMISVDYCRILLFCSSVSRRLK